MNAIIHPCPECGAGENEVCRTPKGRIKRSVHDLRPFSLMANTTPAQDAKLNQMNKQMGL